MSAPWDVASGVLGQVDSTGKTVLTIAALIAVAVGFWRWFCPRWKRLRADATAVRDTLVGRDAVTDTITGREIAPALPSIGERMAEAERQMSTVVTAISKQAEALSSLAESNLRLNDHELRLRDHDTRLRDIEEQRAERIVGKAETVQLLRTIETVAQAEPPRPDDN